MAEGKIYSYLGLAKKAGKTVSGIDGVINSIRGGKSHLVVLALDASDATKKTISDKTSYYKIPLIAYGGKQRLGYSINMGVVSAISITDENLAHLITSAYDKLTGVALNE